MGASFTKTIIVDKDHDEIEGKYYPTIEGAASYLRTEEIGGTIIVEAGEYVLSDLTGDQSTVIVPSNTTIIGRGNAVVKVTHKDISAFVNENDGDERITLSGLKIEVEVTGDPYAKHLIWFTNVNNCVIENISITAQDCEEGVYNAGSTPVAILLYASSSTETCSGNIITGCSIDNFGNQYTVDSVTYFYFGNGISLSTDDSNGKCENNIIESNNVSTNHINCYLKKAANHNIIADNTFRNAQYKVDDEHPGANLLVESCDFTIISGNQCNDSVGSHGIYVNGSKGCVIRSNTCNNNHKEGIKLRKGPEPEYLALANCTIIGNSCHNNGTSANQGNGISLDEKSQHITVYGNTCTGNASHGIRVGAQSDEVENNTIVGNVCHGNISTNEIEPGTAAIIADNMTS